MFAALVFTVASLHLNDGRDYNQVNPGLGVEWGLTTHIGVGAYANSSRRLSVYSTWSREYRFTQRFSAGVELGGVTGYQWPVLPLAFPYARVRVGGDWVLKVSVLPTPRPIVGFQVLRLQ